MEKESNTSGDKRTGKGRRESRHDFFDQMLQEKEVEENQEVRIQVCKKNTRLEPNKQNFCSPGSLLSKLNFVLSFIHPSCKSRGLEGDE